MARRKFFHFLCYVIGLSKIRTLYGARLDHFWGLSPRIRSSSFLHGLRIRWHVPANFRIGTFLTFRLRCRFSLNGRAARTSVAFATVEIFEARCLHTALWPSVMYACSRNRFPFNGPIQSSGEAADCDWFSPVFTTFEDTSRVTYLDVSRRKWEARLRRHTQATRVACASLRLR